MECRLDDKEDSGYRGGQYLAPGLLPKDVRVRSFRWDSEQDYGREGDVAVLYVRAGRGKVFMKDQAYEVGQGTLVILYPFYVRRVRPERGGFLEGTECRMNIGAFLFLFAVRPQKKPASLFDRSPSLYTLGEGLCGRVGKLWDQVLAEENAEDCYGHKMQFALVMRILSLCEKYGTVIK